MEKWILTKFLVVIFSITQVYSQVSKIQSNFTERYSDLRIDCGATSETPGRKIGVASWLTDDTFIKSGENQVTFYSQNFSAFNTIRSFPKGKTNCYNLRFYDYVVYNEFLFRAGFYYGNYDGLSKPPSFNLTIDGNLWATVTTSMDEDDIIYHEMIYIPSKDRAQVCLIRTSDDNIPFISSLEATAISGLHGMYRLMENGTALKLESRISYGENRTILNLLDGQPDDYNRIWKSENISEYLNLIENIIVDDIMFGENNPPWPVMQTAIQAKNISDSIYLSVTFTTQTSGLAYFVFYFRDPIHRFPENGTAQVEVYVNNKKLGGTDVPPWYRTSPDMFHVVSLYPVPVNGSANVTISPAKNSTLAPLLNAMEVFSVFNMTESKAGVLPSVSLAIFLVSIHLLGIVSSTF